MSVSLWRRWSKPALHRAEVAVLGGGITGISAALALERAGVDALVVERHDVASGASGRNAGFLMRGAADNYAAGARELGRDATRRLWRWTEENLAMLRAEGVESLPSYKRVPSALLALTDEEAAELLESVRLMREDGFAVEWAESGTDRVWASGLPKGALLNPGDGSVNPVDLLRMLRGKLRREPLLHHEVSAITLDGAGVRLHAAQAVIEASRCLVGLNAFTPLLLPGVEGVIVPRRGQMLAVRTGRVVFDMSYYAHHGSEYFRQATPEVAVVGGWRKHFVDEEVGYDDRTTENVQRGIEGFAEQFLGRGLDVTARWAGTMGFTADGLPVIGPVDERGGPAKADSPLWICGGYTGHGMSMGFKTAHAAAAAMMTGAENPFPLTRAAIGRRQGRAAPGCGPGGVCSGG
ncbi:MAG: FAD-binding oxidoreductase [Planctomycetota bacterium]|nr:FAD-binding oxidoreductase [Planctomycetota bacterium]